MTNKDNPTEMTAEEKANEKACEIIGDEVAFKTADDMITAIENVSDYVFKTEEQILRLTKEVEELRRTENSLRQINLELREHLQLVSGQSIIGAVKNLESELSSQKQLVEKMAKALNSAKGYGIGPIGLHEINTVLTEYNNTKTQ